MWLAELLDVGRPVPWMPQKDVGDGLVNDADNRLAVDGEAYDNDELAVVRDELGLLIQGIHDPHPALREAG